MNKLLEVINELVEKYEISDEDVDKINEALNGDVEDLYDPSQSEMVIEIAEEPTDGDDEEESEDTEE